MYLPYIYRISTVFTRISTEYIYHISTVLGLVEVGWREGDGGGMGGWVNKKGRHVDGAPSWVWVWGYWKVWPVFLALRVAVISADQVKEE